MLSSNFDFKIRMTDMQLAHLVKSDGKYDLTIFSPESIDRIEKNITEKNGKFFLNCLKRNKDIQVKPEEIVRQLMLDKLVNEYGYPVDLLDVEFTVNFGREKKFADIVILNKADKTSIYCVLEIKKHNAKDGKDQLKSYTNATGAPLAVWTNGTEINYYERLDPNYFEPLSDIPKATETIDDVKNERFTYLELMMKDRLTEERKSLKDLMVIENVSDFDIYAFQNEGIIPSNLTFTRHYKHIFILYDNDKPGINASKKLKEKVQSSSCIFIDEDSGCKDADEFVVKYGKEELNNHLNLIINEARTDG
jgi:type I restriction enzyme M protein